MSPRTYVGPFGRILPVFDDQEIERQRLPEHALDETRTNESNYQLPPPKRLEFGTDVSSGFTDPMRYNTISQPSRSQGTKRQLVSESPKLPSVHQILKPPTASNVSIPPPYSLQLSPTPLQAHGITVLSHQGPSPSHVVGISRYTNGSEHPPPRTPIHAHQQRVVGPRSQTHQLNPFTHQLPSTHGHQQNLDMSPYVPSLESHEFITYTSHGQQMAPPITHHQTPIDSSSSTNVRSTHPTGPAQVQHLQPVNGSVMYPYDQMNAYHTTTAPMTGPGQLQLASSNTVKPQPRLVAERDIPGEGPSWVYEDGTTCKKIIDGEAVNAQWGVTKAGKPRKRLAIACTTCREKKIKCDPAEPKCVQCEKFDRECKFMTA